MQVSNEVSDFVDDNIELSRENIVNIAKTTVNQSECSQWFNISEGRISGAKANSIYTRKRNFDVFADRFLANKKLETEATLYGTQKEESVFAVQKYFARKYQLNQTWSCS